MDDSRTVTVMLEMSGDPVAVVQSKARNKSLTAAQRNAIKAQLKARQDAIRGGIAAQGGACSPSCSPPTTASRSRSSARTSRRWRPSRT